MNNQKILTGYELVSKGATKIEATIPEIGLKDIFPSRTWLEQKQIQAALEARKHLIEVERIEKSGSLSHAVWREEIMLAEVTTQSGGYWQYFGFRREKNLYLKPEEALFLMEINCLHLTHNEVKVSLQQAYALLLRGEVSLLKYKVYASLSRLGYRVFGHEINKNKNLNNNDNATNGDLKPVIEEINTSQQEDNESPKEKHTTRMDVDVENNLNLEVPSVENDTTTIIDVDLVDNTSNTLKRKNKFSLIKLQQLKIRKLKPCNTEELHKNFKNVPDILDKTIVTVKMPDQNLLPNGFNLKKSIYYVDMQKIQNNVKTLPNDRYSPNKEVNGDHIRRLRNDSSTSSNVPPFPILTQIPPLLSQIPSPQTHIPPPQTHIPPPLTHIPPPLTHIPPPLTHIPPPLTHIPPPLTQIPPPLTHIPPYPTFWSQNQNFYRPNYWRPRQSIHYLQLLSSIPPPRFFPPTFPYIPQQTQFRFPFRVNNNTRRKRNRRPTQFRHLQGITNLAARLKNLFLNGNIVQKNVVSLKNLIHTYNIRYKTKLELSDTFEIVEQEVDTIQLDDDEPVNKKPRIDNTINDNLNNLKKIVLRLQHLEREGKSSAKHRRAFSKLLKTFNQSYNEEYFLNDNYELINKQLISIDTSDSSLSDCFIEEVIEEPSAPISKKLKNPFNILKRISEKQDLVEPSTSKENNIVIVKEYDNITLETFNSNWLPDVDDFGRAETNSIGDKIIDVRQEEFLYDFLKIQPWKSNNWLNLKKSYYNSIKEAVAEFQDTMEVSIDSILKAKDCTDMESVFKKLNIVKTEKSVKKECSLSVDFDVYNRDVQNFKKSNPPTPHFRIVCLSETSNMPSGEDIATLHSKYNDKVPIVFAIVGDSFSYVQVNPTDLPVYISNNS